MNSAVEIDLTRIAKNLGISLAQVESAMALLDEGNTVPFITRYRKERTGNLDEEQLRAIQQHVRSMRQLTERAETILRLIETQGILTPQLRAEIARAETLKRLEDLYRPYRPKRQSKAQCAREKGLGPLAADIWNQTPSLTDLHQAAAAFLNPQEDLSTADEVLQGAADILAEQIGEDAEVRATVRKVAWKTGRLVVTPTKSAKEIARDYRDYFDYQEPISKIPPHRVLALNRGENDGALRVKFDCDEDSALTQITKQLEMSAHRFSAFLEQCVHDALKRFVQPSLEREIRRELTDRAESHAVSVFAQNLRQLLLQPPVQGRRVTAIDPGFRTGCKLVALEENGQFLAADLIYVTGSHDKQTLARQKLASFIQQHGCTLVVIGNGTACRETEQLVEEVIAELQPELRYVIVNEAGASIYSASPAAREEFGELDATVRGTISIGRRLQDPLSELVKIDPQHLGVGLYQHDLNEKRLRDTLDQVIESCVNFVGVNLNTASAALLRRVSGLNQLIARRVVQWREKHGSFQTRRQLLDVPGVGPSTYTQAAGFLKIIGGEEPLDNTWIHPESYPVAYRVLERLSIRPDDLFTEDADGNRVAGPLAAFDRATLSRDLQVGRPTLNDILDALARPGRDPRTELPGPIFKRGVLKLDDLHDGMKLTGTVLNVVDFGAFVDIGLKDSALVHISRMSTEFVRNPHDHVHIGDVVTVWILEVDRDRQRVSLTMVPPATPHQTQEQVVADKQSPASTSDSPQESSAKIRKPRQKKRRVSPPPKLAQEQLEGDQPLSGFDELKELWKNRRP